MTVPAAPLPDVVGLIRALSADGLFEGAPWLSGGSGRKVSFFSRASMALASASVALSESASDSRWRLWVPEYFCGDALAPVRHRGLPLSFYPVKDDLSPDLPKDLSGPGALLAVHYFGFPNVLDDVSAACRAAGLTLIEDAAHILVPHKGVGASPWVIYSPHKLLALPAGGVLVFPEDAVSRLPAEAPQESGENARWVVRRMTQAALRAARIPWHRGRSADAASSHSDPVVRALSPFGLSLLKEAEAGFPETARRRRENFLRIGDWMAELPGCRPIHRGLPDSVCPYAYPLFVADAQRVVSRLQALGVPAYRWPDLPPESRGAVARRLAAETVLLPVHQSLLPRELERMRAALHEVFS